MKPSVDRSPKRSPRPKRRTRSPHPGVVLIRPKPNSRQRYWRARYVDPDTGRQVWQRLDPIALPTASTRRTWAIRKSKALAKRKMELESGAPRATGTALADAIERYKRLRRDFGAPEGFGWQMLRRTCGTYLTNAHGIFGAASAYRSAKQLGHSVQVAERHYVNVARGIPREARTPEAAMQIEEQLSRVIEVVHGGREKAIASGAWRSVP